MKKSKVILSIVVLNLINISAQNDYQDLSDLNSKIYVAGHKGLVGSAILRELNKLGYKNIIYRTHKELDLTDQKAVNNFFESEKPEYVFLAAAKVGGIYANNTYPAEFIYSNLIIQSNIIHASYLHGVKKLLFLGSSCIYPRACPQPIREEYLLSSELEPTNRPYALAKISGLEMCQSYNRQYGTRFISCMPTNLYGPNDNFDLNNSHVIPGLIAKFCLAKKENKSEVICWGTGQAKREFLYVDDFAEAAVFLMKNYNSYQNNSWINVGTGEDVTIKELIFLIKDIVGFEGKVVFDSSKPDGTPRKLLDVTKINNLGWKSKTPLKEGLKKAIDWYNENILNKN